MSFKAKILNLFFTPLILFTSYVLLLSDAPVVPDADVVEIKYPPLNSTNKQFVMEGVMYHKEYDNNSLFEIYNTEKILYNYDITDIKIVYTYSNGTSEVSNTVLAIGTGYHFTASIDLTSITNTGVTKVHYSFSGKSKAKNGEGEIVVNDAFTTIVSN